MDERRRMHQSSVALRGGNRDGSDSNTLQLCTYDTAEEVVKLVPHPHIRVACLGADGSVPAGEAANKMGIVNVLAEACPLSDKASESSLSCGRP